MGVVAVDIPGYAHGYPEVAFGGYVAGLLARFDGDFNASVSQACVRTVDGAGTFAWPAGADAAAWGRFRSSAEG